MAAAEKNPVTITCAGPLNGVLSDTLTWVERRQQLSAWKSRGKATRERMKLKRGEG